jgi:hypothetical protein
MYHEAEGNVDVELLAECGQIAQRLRSLEKSWSCEFKELQRRSLLNTFCSPPPLITSLSITQKLSEIYEINVNADESSEDDRNNQELQSRLRYLEDTVIKIHYQQELLRQTQKRNAKAASHKRVHIKGNMNYSAPSGNNNNDLSTSPTAAAIHEHIGSSNNGEHATGSGDNNNKRSILNNDDGNDKDQSANCNKQSQNIYHQQQQLCGRITEDDLRLLLRELKKKVDYTEKMNWLCKFRTV